MILIRFYDHHMYMLVYKQYHYDNILLCVNQTPRRKMHAMEMSIHADLIRLWPRSFSWGEKV